jgi:hypothetical protein
MEETMRPTTAFNDNVFDIKVLLHPSTIFDHPSEHQACPCCGGVLHRLKRRAAVKSTGRHATGHASKSIGDPSLDLVWTFRDIKAKRTLLPVDPDHLRKLIELGLVEMRDKVPVITNAGHHVLD